jgi:hypothetical protein
VAVMVTDANSLTATYNVTIVIGSSGAVTLMISPTTLGTLTSGTALTAVPLTTTPATTAPYTWSVGSGSLPLGLVLNNGTTTSASTISSTTNTVMITGTPTTPGPYSFTITVTDSATPEDSGSQAFSGIVGAALSAACAPNPATRGNEQALTSGTPYAFLLKGSDSSGNPLAWAGSFTPNGTGGITAADVDFVGFTDGPQSLSVNLAGSSYSYDTSGRGCLYLAFSGENEAGVKAAKSSPHAPYLIKNAIKHKPFKALPEATADLNNATFSFSLGQGTTTGPIAEFDYVSSGQIAAGQIHQQTVDSFVLSSLASNFAFGVDGWVVDEQQFIDRTSIAGSFANANGVLSGGTADDNIGGVVSGELSGGSGTLNNNVSTTTGRGTGTYTVTTTNAGPLTFNFAYYVINGSDLFILSTDDPNTLGNFILSGRAIQSAATSQVLNGYYLTAYSGIDLSIGQDGANIVNIGTVQATNTGTIPMAKIYTNDGGTYATNSYTNATYTLEASTGRISYTGFGTYPPVVYVTSTTNEDDIVGFLVGTGPDSSSGIVAFQAPASPGPNFSASDIEGGYAFGTTEDVAGQNGSEVGLFEFDGIGNFSAVNDIATFGENASQPNQVFSGTYTVNPDGSGNFGSGNPVFVTNGSLGLAIDTSNTTQPQLYIFAQQVSGN